MATLQHRPGCRLGWIQGSSDVVFHLKSGPSAALALLMTQSRACAPQSAPQGPLNRARWQLQSLPVPLIGEALPLLLACTLIGLAGPCGQPCTNHRSGAQPVESVRAFLIGQGTNPDAHSDWTCSGHVTSPAPITEPEYSGFAPQPGPQASPETKGISGGARVPARGGRAPE